MKKIILAIFPLLLLGPVLSIGRENINYDWQDLFPDPLERVYVIMKDGTIFLYTSHYGDKVYASMGELERMLKKRGSSIKEIAIVIHNHRKEKSFSRSDYKQYWTLKAEGFDGRFLLYCHRTKEVYDIENKEKLK